MSWFSSWEVTKQRVVEAASTLSVAATAAASTAANATVKHLGTLQENIQRFTEQVDEALERDEVERQRRERGSYPIGSMLNVI